MYTVLKLPECKDIDITHTDSGIMIRYLSTQALRHDERFHVLQYCLDIDWRYWYYVFRCININKKYFVHAWVDTASCFSYFLLNEAFSLSLTCDLLFYLQITVFVS